MTEDKIITGMKNICKMIKETKNDKLYYAFLNFYEDCVVSFRDELEKSRLENETARKTSELSFSKIVKTEGELHDMRVEDAVKHNSLKKEVNDLKLLKDERTKNIVNEAQENIMKTIHPFFDAMPNVNKAVLNSPRMCGLLLLLQGRKFVYNITKISFDDMLNGKPVNTSSNKESKP